jgi:hypothetical protein
MTNTPLNQDSEWDYLSDVLDSSNDDEDLIESDVPAPHAKKPKSIIEAQIKNLVSPNPELSTVSGLRPGKAHLHGQFRQASGRYVKQGMHVTEAIFSDSTGSVRVVWFNQPYRATYLRQGVDYELRGTFALSRGRFQINSANVRPLEEGCRPFDKKDPKK